jgi:gluconokinase
VVKAKLYVVMGVSGSGKSTVGAAFARAIGVEFVEGDRYHPPENVKRMEAGIPLTDDDRAGWLRALSQRLREADERGSGLILACSALKRSYRDVLRQGASDLQFIFLRGSRPVIAKRIAGRRGHFMPTSLLESQFAALEEPAADEQAWVCDVEQPVEELVSALLEHASA